MSTEYQRLMRQYQIPPGALTNQQLKLLQRGGIQLDDSDDQYNVSYTNKPTKTKIHNYNQIKPYAQSSQLEAMKQIYQGQILKRDNQISYLQNQALHIQKIHQAQLLKIQNQYVIQIQKLNSQLHRARSQVIHTQGQLPLVKQAVNKIRQMLSGMESQTVYLRLRELNQRDLPVAQWILVNVWQIVYPYKKQLDYNRKQTSKLRQQIKTMNDKFHQTLNQLQHYQRLLNSKDDDSKRHNLNFDNTRKSLQLQILKLQEQVQILRQKGARYDQLFRDYQFTKQQKQLLQQKIGYYNNNIKTQGQSSKFTHQQQQRRKIDLLSQDKQYLTKQNISLIQKQRRLQDRLDRLQAQLLNSKNQSRQYLSQLLNLKTDSVSNYQQKIYRQINQLKQKHNHELQMAKNNLVDIYQKQIRFLRQTLDQKQLKCQNLQRQVRQKTKQNQQTMIDTRSFQRKFDSDLSQARLSLKIKSEQLDRINNIYQQTLANLNSHKLQNQMLRQKLNCLKGEYYKSQANNKDQMSSLKAQVAVLREQLANYELIQKQIDQTVLSLGKLNPSSPQNAIFTSTITSVPSSNKRRIQQSLGLAQRLQAKQKDHELTIQQLRVCKLQLQQVKDQLKVAKSLLDKTNQPYSYLVNNIQQKQKQVMLLRKQIKKFQQDYNNIRQQYRVLSRQLQQAQRDVQRLLIKRQSIQNVQKILIELTRGPVSKQMLGSAVDQIKLILGSTNNNSIPNKLQRMDNTSSNNINQVPTWYKKLLDKKK